MSLALGIAILAFAVLLGGLAAFRREHGRRVMPGIRMFAVVAAVSIVCLHLVPEAIAEAGWWVLFAAAGAFCAPVLLEHLFPSTQAHSRQAPFTALAMGYTAVLVHQVGEGAVVASLDRIGALSPAIVLAIAAHTTPLAMVIAIRVLEAKGRDDTGLRATALALAGLMLATAAGATIGLLVSAADLDSVRPWILAGISGLLLHALVHDASSPPATRLRGRAGEAFAGLLGLGLAFTSVAHDTWVQHLSASARWIAMLVAAALVVAWTFLRGRPIEPPTQRSPSIRTAAEPRRRSVAPDLRDG